MPGLGRLSKQLICAHCDVVIATAEYRPLLSWRPEITSPDGNQLAPIAGSILLRIAEQELASAEPAERDQAQRRVSFIRRQLWEVIYDLPCPRGHRTLITSPQVVRAMRRAKGDWVFLGEAAR